MNPHALKNAKKTITVLAAGLMLLAGAFTAGADESWMYHDIVENDFVIAHVTVPMAENIMVIDSRPYKPMYIKGHIPGAVSIPDTEFDKKTDLLPADKNALLIFYCGGVECKLSHKSAQKAEKLGYKNVKVFAKGFPEWMAQPGAYASVSADYVAAKIAENKTLLVDSRPHKPTFEKGHIPTAVSIPDSQFDQLSGKLPRSLETPVIFYCGGLHCTLSHKSAARALVMGYKDVSVFDMGYPEWKARFGAAENMAAVKAGEVEGSIDLERFKTLLEENPESMLLVDTRDADEFAKGHFKTAVNIPVADLEDKIPGFPADKPVVFVCSTGARSGEAYYMTRDVRESLTDVYYVEAQIGFKKDGTYTIKAPK
jgi:rhodanese-related sulfurtransferase